MSTTSSSILLLFSLFTTVIFGSPHCRDQNGNDVDWWVILKVPIISGSSNPVLGEGFGYAYADPSTDLQLTDNSLSDSDGPLANTLKQLYNGNSRTGWIMYDDEWPDGSKHESYGHTKGDIMLDSDSGFWLVHSVPRFPNATKLPYSFPEDETKYGQSFLCISLDITQFNTIGAAFLLNKPAVFDINIPNSILNEVPSFGDVQNGNWNSSSGYTGTAQITSLAGQVFTVFSTNSEWKQNLYSDLVEGYYQSGLFVESWMNGENSNKMPSFCTPKYPYDTINVRQVTLSSDATWLETQDHSKWAITIDTKGITCIGDKNRQFSQAKRGGGTVCFKNKAIYNSFSNIISQADKC